MGEGGVDRVRQGSAKEGGWRGGGAESSLYGEGGLRMMANVRD